VGERVVDVGGADPPREEHKYRHLGRGVGRLAVGVVVVYTWHATARVCEGERRYRAETGGRGAGLGWGGRSWRQRRASSRIEGRLTTSAASASMSSGPSLVPLDNAKVKE